MVFPVLLQAEPGSVQSLDSLRLLAAEESEKLTAVVVVVAAAEPEPVSEAVVELEAGAEVEVEVVVEIVEKIGTKSS